MGSVLGFESVPAVFYPALGAILALYVVTAEAAKRLYFAWRPR